MQNPTYSIILDLTYEHIATAFGNNELDSSLEGGGRHLAFPNNVFKSYPMNMAKNRRD